MLVWEMDAAGSCCSHGSYWFSSQPDRVSAIVTYYICIDLTTCLGSTCTEYEEQAGLLLYRPAFRFSVMETESKWNTIIKLNIYIAYNLVCCDSSRRIECVSVSISPTWQALGGGKCRKGQRSQHTVMRENKPFLCFYKEPLCAKSMPPVFNEFAK